jgi:formylglycine-generating enzyme required for sulfatase activity
METVEWRLPIKPQPLIAMLGLLALVLLRLWPAIQRNMILAQIEQGISEQAWPQVALDLGRLWNQVEDSSQVDPWFEQALGELQSIHSSHTDIRAHIQLIQWLLDQGAPGAARALLDQNIISIAAGSSIMGSEAGSMDEQPARTITLSAYQIDRFEVTNLQYSQFLASEQVISPRYWHDAEYPGRMDLHPVVGVSWDQAQRYCEWTGKRLPTEAEWERACRGDQGVVYPWGDDWTGANANLGLSWSQAWPSLIDDAWQLLEHEQAQGLSAVGSYPQGISPYGISDLIGNAAEWVYDWYNWDGYQDMPDTNPVNLDPPWNHVVRGNGWFSRWGWVASVAQDSRCSARSSSHSYDDPRIGFRCADDALP